MLCLAPATSRTAVCSVYAFCLPLLSLSRQICSVLSIFLLQIMLHISAEMHLSVYSLVTSSSLLTLSLKVYHSFARDMFVWTNCCIIAIMFICGPSGCGLSIHLSVWDGRALWSYGHVSADLSLWLDSPVFWAPWHQSMSTYSQLSFSSSSWKRDAVWMCKLGEELNANNDK